MLSVYLAAATPLHELCKLPALLDHFQEHRREDPTISVLGFIVLHYLSGSPRDADYARDMQLPFKTLEITPLGLAAAHHLPTSFELRAPAPAFCCRRLPVWALMQPPSPYLAMPPEPPEA